MRRLKGAATASRMQLRRCGESSGRGTDDVERPVVIGSASTVQSRVERSRTVMAPAGSAAGHVVALALTTSRRWRWPERVPWPAAPVASSGPGDPPIRIARAGLLDLAAHNLIRFIAIAIRFWQSRPVIPCQETPSFLLERRVPDRKSVIAVADCRFPRRLPWQIPMSPFTPLGSRNGRAGEVLWNEPMDSSLAMHRSPRCGAGTGAEHHASYRL
jgi:hypothetical protein